LDILPSLMVVAAAFFVVDSWQLTAAWYFMKTFQLQGIWMGIGLGLGVTGCLLLVQVSLNLNKLST
jgi:hypothetical protein